MIRKLTKEDIPFIVKLEEDIFGESIGPELLSDSFTNSAYDFRVYLLDNEIVGYISTCFIEDFGDIYNFCIKKELQHKGIGSELFSSILNDHPKCSISLEVRKSNVNAISFYKKHNFEIVSVRKEYYADKEDAYVMLRK